jgi:hypothetical protein
MLNILRSIASFFNYIHDILIKLSKTLGLNLTDKQLHFLVVGILGIILFILVNKIFHTVARYSLKAVSFIYTFTVLIVLVLAIEIEQKITGRGNMEFADIVNGIWGFVALFILYILIELAVKKFKQFIRKHRLFR